MERKKEQKVPLTIYIEHERHVIGEAVVTGREVKCQITEEGNAIADLITQGLDVKVGGSFTFRLPPDLPDPPGKKKLRRRDGEDTSFRII